MRKLNMAKREFIFFEETKLDLSSVKTKFTNFGSSLLRSQLKFFSNQPDLTDVRSSQFTGASNRELINSVISVDGDLIGMIAMLRRRSRQAHVVFSMVASSSEEDVAWRSLQRV